MLFFAVPAAFAEIVLVLTKLEGEGRNAAWTGLANYAAVLGGGYVLGLVAQTVVSPVVAKAGSVLRVLLLKLAAPRIPRDDSRSLKRPLLLSGLCKVTDRLDLDAWPFSSSGRGLLTEAVNRALTDAEVPGSVARVYPVQSAGESLAHSSAQLAQTAPSQYQEYDRLRAESELRIAVAPALLGLSIVVPLQSKATAIAVASAISVVLLVQAVSITRRAHDLLSNGAYLKYIEVPAVQAVVAALPGVRSGYTGSMTEGSWAAAMAIALDRRGHLRDAKALLMNAMEHFWRTGDGLEVMSARSYLMDMDSDLTAFWNTREAAFSGEGAEQAEAI